MTTVAANVLLPRLLSLLALAAAAAANEAGFCLQGAHNLLPDSFGAEAGGMARGAPPPPPAAPALAAFDWPLGRPANKTLMLTHYEPCHREAPIFRYRAAGGAIYVDHDHHADGRYASYRLAFLEQLALSMWLYKDWPDSVDLVVDLTDHPQLCDQDIPFLRYSLLNASALPPEQRYNLTELLAPAWVTPAYAARVRRHTRGFTIPSPEAWRDLSLTQRQLADFASCMDATHPWGSKRPLVFWRGQATGCSRGWPRAGPAGTAAAGTAAAEAAGPAPHLLRNKRVQAALRLFPYGGDVADVGITSLPRLTPECLGVPRAGHRWQQPLSAGSAGGAQAAAPGAAAGGQQQMPRGRRRRRRHTRRSTEHLPGGSLDPAAKSFLTWHLRSSADGGAQADAAGSNGGGGVEGGSAPDDGRRLAVSWRPWRRRRQQPQDAQAGGSQPEPASSSSSSGGGGGGGEGAAPSQVAVSAPYRAVASLLHKEGIGLEGWADAAVTLSIDGYGPPFRLPQQLLLGSAVLKMASPYATWLDPHLLPGTHYEQFGYDLGGLEEGALRAARAARQRPDEAGQAQAGGGGGGGGRLRRMAAAARAAVVERVNVVAQLDAFAWSVARVKEAQAWPVSFPGPGDATWRLLRLRHAADVFRSKGVPQAVQLQVMQHLRANFEEALRRPAFASGAAWAAAAGGTTTAATTAAAVAAEQPP